MELSLTIAYCFAASTASVVGMFTSGFVVSFNLLDCAKAKSLNTCDFILFVLGVSYTCFQCTLIRHAYVTITILYYGFIKLNYSTAVLGVLEIWTGSCSFWNTSCLCVFYCMKIVDFSHRLFFWLKARIAKLVPWFLAGSAAGSFVLSIPLYCEYDGTSSEMLTTNLTTNITDAILKDSSYFTVAVALGFCLPVLIDIASITLILASLFRHTRRMKDNASGFSAPRLQAHFGAARMVGSLLFVFIVYLLAQSYVLHSTGDWFDVIAQILCYCISAEQSTILLLGNTRLRQGLWKFLKLWRR